MRGFAYHWSRFRVASPAIEVGLKLSRFPALGGRCRLPWANFWQWTTSQSNFVCNETSPGGSTQVKVQVMVCILFLSSMWINVRMSVSLGWRGACKSLLPHAYV